MFSVFGLHAPLQFILKVASSVHLVGVSVSCVLQVLSVQSVVGEPVPSVVSKVLVGSSFGQLVSSEEV